MPTISAIPCSIILVFFHVYEVHVLRTASAYYVKLAYSLLMTILCIQADGLELCSLRNVEVLDLRL